MDRIYDSYFNLDRHYQELNSKHFKTHYKGKPTKKYSKLIQQINRAEGISSYEIERLIIS